MIFIKKQKCDNNFLKVSQIKQFIDETVEENLEYIQLTDKVCNMNNITVMYALSEKPTDYNTYYCLFEPNKEKQVAEIDLNEYLVIVDTTIEGVYDKLSKIEYDKLLEIQKDTIV